MNVLWVIPKWTLPAIDGARVATEKLVSNFIKQGVNVDILCFAQRHEIINEQEMIEKWGCRSVKIIYRDLPQSKLQKIIYYGSRILKAPFTPLTFSSFTGSKIQKDVSEFLFKGQSYDYTVLDGLHLYMPFRGLDFHLRRKLGKMILRSHNMEQDLWFEAAKKRFGLIKAFFNFQGRLVKDIENHVIKTVDGVASISQDDLKQIKQLSLSPSWLTPLGMKFVTSYKESTDDKLKLLFIGRLDWEPNKEGLEDFLQNIWPEVLKKRSDIHLDIIGSGNSSWLEGYRNLDNLTIHGFVDSIDSFYESCDYTIVPLNFGSGTRIKVIESISKGAPLISTKLGVQGSGLDHSMYVECNSHKEWIKTLSLLSKKDNAEELFNRAQNQLAKTFDEEKVAKDFYEHIKQL